jgi:hypothetical protein
MRGIVRLRGIVRQTCGRRGIAMACSLPLQLPIHPAMLWTFGRRHERLSIGRRPDGCALVVVTPGEEREHHFADLSTLTSFQADMETFLLKTGWTLLRFSPERRSGRDRRRFPRLEERRRWWTDSAELRKVVRGEKASWPSGRHQPAAAMPEAQAGRRWRWRLRTTTNRLD